MPGHGVAENKNGKKNHREAKIDRENGDERGGKQGGRMAILLECTRMMEGQGPKSVELWRGKRKRGECCLFAGNALYGASRGRG